MRIQAQHTLFCSAKSESEDAVVSSANNGQPTWEVTADRPTYTGHTLATDGPPS
jgi:hypothetical protein